MSFTVTCQQCGQQFAVAPHLYGRCVNCTACGAALRIPNPHQDPAPVSPSPGPGYPRGTPGVPFHQVSTRAASTSDRRLIILCSVIGGATIVLLFGALLVSHLFKSEGDVDPRVKPAPDIVASPETPPDAKLPSQPPTTPGPSVPVPTEPSPVARPLSLSEARKGFATKLLRRESAGEPLPNPPPSVFRVVEFDSAVGKLAAYLTPDSKDGEKHPAIIWVTGGDCSTLGDNLWQNPPPGNDQTARQFREAGIVTMFPTQRGGNQNPGFHEGFYGEVDDVLSAAEFLSTQEYVDPERIYLGGHSSGATLVLLAAECSSRFRAVFSIGPTDDIRAYPREYNSLFQPFDTSDRREFELRAPGLWLHSIQDPTFVFAGTVRDGALLAVLRMAGTSTNSKVHFFPVAGADHFDIIAPTNRLIAQKILRDENPDCNIVFTKDELNRPFAR